LRAGPGETRLRRAEALLVPRDTRELMPVRVRGASSSALGRAQRLKEAR